MDPGGYRIEIFELKATGKVTETAAWDYYVHLLAAHLVCVLIASEKYCVFLLSSSPGPICIISVSIESTFLIIYIQLYLLFKDHVTTYFLHEWIYLQFWAGGMIIYLGQD